MIVTARDGTQFTICNNCKHWVTEDSCRIDKCKCSKHREEENAVNL